MRRAAAALLAAALLAAAALAPAPAAAAVLAVDLGAENLKLAIVKPGRIPISIGAPAALPGLAPPPRSRPPLLSWRRLNACRMQQPCAGAALPPLPPPAAALTLCLPPHAPPVPPPAVINEMSKRKTPALVAFVDGDRLVGEEAAALSARYPDRVYGRLTDLLGRPAADPGLAAMLKASYRPYELAPAANRSSPAAAALRTDDGQLVSAEEAVASLLEYARRLAEADVGDGSPVTDAVLTVPASFTPQQARGRGRAGRAVVVHSETPCAQRRRRRLLGVRAPHARPQRAPSPHTGPPTNSARRCWTPPSWRGSTSWASSTATQVRAAPSLAPPQRSGGSALAPWLGRRQRQQPPWSRVAAVPDLPLALLSPLPCPARPCILAQPPRCSTASSATSPTAPRRRCCTTWAPPACRPRWSPTPPTPTPRWGGEQCGGCQVAGGWLGADCRGREQPGPVAAAACSAAHRRQGRGGGMHASRAAQQRAARLPTIPAGRQHQPV